MSSDVCYSALVIDNILIAFARNNEHSDQITSRVFHHMICFMHYNTRSQECFFRRYLTLSIIIINESDLSYSHVFTDAIGK